MTLTEPTAGQSWRAWGDAVSVALGVSEPSYGANWRTWATAVSAAAGVTAPAWRSGWQAWADAVTTYVNAQSSSYTRPSGAGYVTQESLPTQTPFYSLLNQSSVGTLASPNVVTFPAGTWTWNDFAYGSNDYGWFGWDPCIGIAGSGKDQTILKMVTETSTQVSRIPTQGAGGVNPLWLGRFGSASNSAGRAVEFAGVTVVGTDQPIFTATDTPGHATGQPHGYNGIQLYFSNGAHVHDCRFVGIRGTYAANPGENFALAGFHDQNSLFERVEVDGRWAGADGSNYANPTTRIGASGIGMNYGLNLTTVDCYSHDNLYGAGITHYQQNGTISHTRFQSTDNEIGFNFEACGASATTINMNQCDVTRARSLATSGTYSGRMVWGVIDSQFGSCVLNLRDCTQNGARPSAANPLLITIHSVYPGGNGANKQLASDVHYFDQNGVEQPTFVAIVGNESLPDN